MKKIFALLLAVIIVFAFSGCGDKLGLYYFDDADKYTAGDAVISERVTCLDIEWISGEVHFEIGTDDTLSLHETWGGELDDDFKLRYRLEDGTLTVKYCASKTKLDVPEVKILNVTLPQGTAFEEISLQTVSADVFADPGITAKKLDCETVSGMLYLDLSEITENEIETVSGDTQMIFSANTASLSLETVSGGISLTDKSDAGFTLKYDSINGNLTNDLETEEQDDGTYVYGDGNTKLNIRSVSGNVEIRK